MAAAAAAAAAAAVPSWMGSTAPPPGRGGSGLLDDVIGLADDDDDGSDGAAARVSAAFGRLRPGVEVDYNAVDAVWVPARVVLAAEGGALVAVRFAAGAADVTHVVDTDAPGVAARFAAIGTHSCPVVAGQLVDVLRTQGAAGVLGPSQQWQRGTLLLCAPRAGAAAC